MGPMKMPELSSYDDIAPPPPVHSFNKRDYRERKKAERLQAMLQKEREKNAKLQAQLRELTNGK